MTKNDLVTVRELKEADKNFIFSTFLRGLFYGDSWYSHIDKNIFMKNYHIVIDSLLSKPTTKVKVACLKEDSDTIVGYAIMNQDETVVHWTFCKKAWRGIGIAKSLVGDKVKLTTHLTKSGLAICSKKKIAFDPFSI